MRFGDRIIYDSGLPQDAKVDSIIWEGEWRWPVANSLALLMVKPFLPGGHPPWVGKMQCDGFQQGMGFSR